MLQFFLFRCLCVPLCLTADFSSCLRRAMLSLSYPTLLWRANTKRSNCWHASVWVQTSLLFGRSVIERHRLRVLRKKTETCLFFFKFSFFIRVLFSPLVSECCMLESIPITHRLVLACVRLYPSPSNCSLERSIGGGVTLHCIFFTKKLCLCV